MQEALARLTAAGRSHAVVLRDGRLTDVVSRGDLTTAVQLRAGVGTPP